MALAWLLPLLLLVQSAGGSPEQFFVGRTEGVGTVRVVLSGSHGVRVSGQGRMERDALILEQRVFEEGEQPRTQIWRLVREGPNRVAGSMSHARGPVTGRLVGNVLHLRHRNSDGYSVEQWITFLPGGRTARNRMTYRRFGIIVATVDETIRRVD
ncbi:MAG: DUF3833 family protein [Sphingosinicella sp.]